ncbi:MAG: DNA primase [Parcubacteria group bacterium CG1_02_37_51]|uniref:DNA primase n=1 Tax=Candidatus Komeilibacteria bacterium CG_4_10_14_0_8_um_filter_37_78 TaxID=1974471 RepID=A0A2M7REE0_9BACT|nr:MAG: DNA primase [Parcubacteria group bacterium CG1_02_37_51]PIY94921.1 MAG: DNA primase [Candidatus Komeilibacteria bacterium CG_4_10_14_0_8_um_filter_37_78]
MQDNTEAIKQRIDITDLVQEYIKLTPAGANNFKANCPFHNEKTPSFMVSKDKQIWHCFGCGEGGDIFSWVQKMEGVDFPEALRILAKKANVELQWQQPELSSAKTKLLDICKAASNYWHELLIKDEQAKFVRDYLEERQIQSETILIWQLGWARESWDDLLNYLKEQGFKEQDIFDAGLIIKSEKKNSYYDRFRNRLTFPITNHHGQVVGFTARTMANEEAKYINTPQTVIYNKSNILYGLEKAKSAIRKQNYTILVEGNMDVITVWQVGTQNVVGVSGTALTLEQVSLLKRYSPNVMIAFDSDSAGQKASLRGLDIAWQEGLNVKIIKLKAGKDPDECIKQDKQLWLQSIKEAVNIIDYYFEMTIADLDLQRSDHKKKAAVSLLPVIARLPDAIDRIHYLQKLADLINISVNVLEDKINSLKKQEGTIVQTEEKSAPMIKRDPLELLTRRIIAILLWQPSKISLVIDRLLPEELSGESYQTIYKELVIHYNKGAWQGQEAAQARQTAEALFIDKKEILDKVNTLSLLAVKDFQENTDHELDYEIDLLITRLKEENKKNIRQKISDELSQADARGDRQKVDELLERLNKLN